MVILTEIEAPNSSLLTPPAGTYDGDDDSAFAVDVDETFAAVPLLLDAYITRPSNVDVDVDVVTPGAPIIASNAIEAPASTQNDD